jgi:menaquinol-cytochrome c reductase iron-sulfur subunit
MADNIPAEQPNRRSLLTWAIFGISAIFSAILGVPIVAYVLDPRNRKGPKSEMRLVEGVKLDDLIANTPVQGVVRDTRMDGWTLYPNDVLGRVWVVQVGARPANVAEMTEAQKNAYLMVFTTICPHLGCSVNTGPTGFACPCHAATFRVDGTRAAAANPAQRGMDTLAWEIDPDDPEHNRIKVTYKKYEANNAKKIPLGGGEPEKAND